MKIKEEEMISWLKLCNVRGLGPKRIIKLIEYFGEINKVYSSTDQELLRTNIFNEAMIKDWDKLKNAQSDKYREIIDLCVKEKISILPLFLNEYPKKLKYVPDPPKNLFLKGDLSLILSKKFAIAGSRNSDEKSRRWAYSIAKELAKKGVAIVSGGAKGIDYQAHRGALDANERTICIFGTGLLNYYPEEHKNLYEEILNKGLLISEHLPTFTGGRIALLNRNRIISGLCEGLLQVTSSNGGGSATQMRIALQQRIPVFCPKEELGFSPSEGILRAKKENRLIEVENIEDLLSELSKIENRFSSQQRQRTIDPFTKRLLMQVKLH